MFARMISTVVQYFDTSQNRYILHYFNELFNFVNQKLFTLYMSYTFWFTIHLFFEIIIYDKINLSVFPKFIPATSLSKLQFLPPTPTIKARWTHRSKLVYTGILTWQHSKKEVFILSKYWGICLYFMLKLL